MLQADANRKLEDDEDLENIYGVQFKSIVVLSRHFKGEIAGTIDKATTRAIQARSDANAVLTAAQADAQAIRLRAEAEAAAVHARATVDALVNDDHSREMQRKRLEVQRIAAFGSRTTFVPTETGFTQQASSGVAHETGRTTVRDHRPEAP